MGVVTDTSSAAPFFYSEKILSIARKNSFIFFCQILYSLQLWSECDEKKIDFIPHYRDFFISNFLFFPRKYT